MRTPRWFQRFVASAEKANERRLTKEVRDLGEMLRESRADPFRVPKKDNGEPLGAQYAEFSDQWERRSLEVHAELDEQLRNGTEGTIVHVGYHGVPSLVSSVAQAQMLEAMTISSDAEHEPSPNRCEGT